MGIIYLYRNIIKRHKHKEIAHPPRQRGVIGRRGASLDELAELYRSRFDVFARVAASVTVSSLCNELPEKGVQT
jgi:hypothetical protein